MRLFRSNSTPGTRTGNAPRQSTSPSCSTVPARWPGPNWKKPSKPPASPSTSSEKTIFSPSWFTTMKSRCSSRRRRSGTRQRPKPAAAKRRQRTPQQGRGTEKQRLVQQDQPQGIPIPELSGQKSETLKDLRYSAQPQRWRVAGPRNPTSRARADSVLSALHSFLHKCPPAG